MATAAKGSSIKKHGTATTFTAAAMALVSGQTYQLTDATKRILNPARTNGVEVYDNAVLVAPANYTVDWVYGKVTFAGSYSVTGPVTMTGEYYPTAALAEVREYSFTASVDIQDATVFGNDAHLKLPALKDLSGSLKALVPDTHEHNGAGTTFNALKTTPWLLEIDYPGSGFFRAWVLAESVETGASVEGLIETTVNFVSAPQLAAGEDYEGTQFGWGT